MGGLGRVQGLGLGFRGQGLEFRIRVIGCASWGDAALSLEGVLLFGFKSCIGVEYKNFGVFGPRLRLKP